MGSSLKDESYLGTRQVRSRKSMKKKPKIMTILPKLSFEISKIEKFSKITEITENYRRMISNLSSEFEKIFKLSRERQ